MILIDGRLCAAEFEETIKKEVEILTTRGEKKPHLAAILVGNDGASETYVNGKVKACERVGFDSTLLRFDDRISENELLDQIRKLNENPEIDGFIVQLPLPKHVDVSKVIEAINPQKDVDGFHPINVGRMAKGLPAYISATPFGILKLLERYQIETVGKHCVILGRSQIVGAPMSMLMTRNTSPGNCTVTVCHSKTRNIEKYTREADILIAAMGQPGFVNEGMVKEGAVVIDVGTTRLADVSKKSGFRLSGDVDFEAVSNKTSYITPVPGGVGPMTITGLLLNTLSAAKKEFYG